MDKRGSALIFAFLVVMVLTILSVGFMIRSVNENRLAVRQVASMQVFWAAEAGVSRALADLPSINTYSDIVVVAETPNVKYNVSTIEVTPAGNSDRVFEMSSTGFVENTDIRRGIRVSAVFTPPTPDFDAAIEVRNTLDVTGSPTISGPPYPDEPCDDKDPCNDKNNYTRQNSNFTFLDKFDLTTEVVMAYAASHGTYFETPDDPATPEPPVYNPLQSMSDGVYWIRVTEPNKKLQIPKNGWIANNSIIIVEGNCDFEGGDLDGVLWVMGELRISGNPDVNGAIISEQTAEYTDVTGNGDFYYDPDVINKTADLIENMGSRAIRAWREF